MNGFGTAARRVALLVAVVALSAGAGSAGAAGGGEATPPGQANATSAPGNSENAPGKATKTATTTTTTSTSASKGAAVSATAKAKNDATPAAASTAAKTAKPTKTKPATTKPAKTKPARTKPAKTTGDSQAKSYKVNSSGTNLDKPGQNHRHTICHATGSATNPYVRISPSVSGVYNGHLAHQDGRDIIPPFTYKGTQYKQNWPSGQAIFDAGCATSTTPPPPPAAGATSKKVTICHATGSARNPFVILTIDESGWLNGHKGHAGDVFIGEGEVAGVTPERCATTTTSGVTPPPPPGGPIAGNSGKGSGGTLNAASTPKQAAPGKGSGGVLGAQAELPANNAPAAATSAAERPARGVLGTVKRLGSTATSETLPFTGLPLWVVLASGLALLAVGLGLRRGWARS